MAMAIGGNNKDCSIGQGFSNNTANGLSIFWNDSLNRATWVRFGFFQKQKAVWLGTSLLQEMCNLLSAYYGKKGRKGHLGKVKTVFPGVFVRSIFMFHHGQLLSGFILAQHHACRIAGQQIEQ